MRPGEARFGPELNGEKLWRRQVFGARMGARKERKVFFYRDSEGAFGIESATMRGSFWTRIRWGKAVAAPGVRGQGAREKWKKTVFVQRLRLGAKVRPGEARFGPELGGEKLWRRQVVFGAKMGARKERKVLFFNRDSEGVRGQGA